MSTDSSRRLLKSNEDTGENIVFGERSDPGEGNEVGNWQAQYTATRHLRGGAQSKPFWPRDTLVMLSSPKMKPRLAQSLTRVMR